jgi:virginiamycin B lyase
LAEAGSYGRGIIPAWAHEKFETFPSSKRGAQVRQMLGRPGEAWGAESGNDRLVQIKY